MSDGKLKLTVRPTTLRAANDFVAEHHRHNGRTARNGGKFAVQALLGGQLVGVAIVGNPLSATYMNRERYGYVAEVLRVCTVPSSPKGAVSFLYGACWRIWRDMGGQRLITYTLQDETGASMRGAGWRRVAEVRATEPNWRKNDHLADTRTFDARSQGQSKYRWEVTSSDLKEQATA